MSADRHNTPYRAVTESSAVAVALTSYGGFKLMEEAGELVQALGKLGPFPCDPHPDGGPPLRERIEAEAGDVIAALRYFIETNGLNMERVMNRAEEKVRKFRKWGLTGFDGREAPKSVPVERNSEAK